MGLVVFEYGPSADGDISWPADPRAAAGRKFRWTIFDKKADVLPSVRSYGRDVRRSAWIANIRWPAVGAETSTRRGSTQLSKRDLAMGSLTFNGRDFGDVRDEWPERPPRDLAVRLAGALQYENCGPQDLWDEIGDWLGQHSITPPNIANIPLVSQEPSVSGSRKFLTRTQEGSAMQLTRLVYTSKHRLLNPVGIDRILQKSRANNVRDLVTGALIVGETHFMQLIEGSRLEISRCFMRIMQDKSHYDIQVISCGDVAHRLFQEWSMHLIRASRIKEDIISGYKIDGSFNPSKMSEFAIEDLCRTLSAGNWEAEAA